MPKQTFTKHKVGNHTLKLKTNINYSNQDIDKVLIQIRYILFILDRGDYFDCGGGGGGVLEYGFEYEKDDDVEFKSECGLSTKQEHISNRYSISDIL